MAYNFATRLDRLGSRMKQLHDNTLTLQRAGETDVTVTNFTPEKLDVNLLAAHGIFLLEEKAQDFVFDTSEFSSWTTTKPQVGDKLIWDSKTYEVFRMGPSESDGEVFNYTTSSRQRVRIHTKQIA